MEWFEPFVYGLVIGYVWNPIWHIGKKIVSEAKKAKQEWRNPQ